MQAPFTYTCGNPKFPVFLILSNTITVVTTTTQKSLLNTLTCVFLYWICYKENCKDIVIHTRPVPLSYKENIHSVNLTFSWHIDPVAHSIQPSLVRLLITSFFSLLFKLSLMGSKIQLLLWRILQYHDEVGVKLYEVWNPATVFPTGADTVNKGKGCKCSCNFYRRIY